MKLAKAFAFTMLMACCVPVASAVTIEMVAVGNPGNAPDTRYNSIAVGSVNYSYQIGKYEVTAGQYTEFLNAVAKADPNGLYNEAMAIPFNAGGALGANIQRIGSSPNFSYSVAADWANRPVNYVSFRDAARFANWLHNGQQTGPQAPATLEYGAYHNINDSATFARQPGALIFIPTEDEWYKAAYHNMTARLSGNYFDYPTGTNSTPGNDVSETTNSGNNANIEVSSLAIGGPYYRTLAGEFEFSDSPYGTFDQGGNVYEWNETKFLESARGVRGGTLGGGPTLLHASVRMYGDPTGEDYSTGFRVAGVVPEPCGVTLFTVGLILLSLYTRERILCSADLTND